jgi:hypothetical protein
MTVDKAREREEFDDFEDDTIEIVRFIDDDGTTVVAAVIGVAEINYKTYLQLDPIDESNEKTYYFIYVEYDEEDGEEVEGGYDLLSIEDAKELALVKAMFDAADELDELLEDDIEARLFDGEDVE